MPLIDLLRRTEVAMYKPGKVYNTFDIYIQNDSFLYSSKKLKEALKNFVLEELRKLGK